MDPIAMRHANAYHVVVHALEARAGWKPSERFASVITHTIDGHLPYERYHSAGIARRREGMTDGLVERMVAEWMHFDANPGQQMLTGLAHLGNAVAAFNAYLESAPLAVRSTLILGGNGAATKGLAMERSMRAATTDPTLCRAAVLAAFEGALDRVRHNAAQGQHARVRPLSAFAQELGAGHLAAAELAVIFEKEGSIPIEQAARRLGCHQRTLERRLREEGLTAEGIRQAARLLEATSRLRSAASLTTIAVETGFSDLAHMSRAFRQACGQSPSSLRAAARGLVVPEKST